MIISNSFKKLEVKNTEHVDIKKKQDKINQTDYWDCRILDLQILYFGDEVHLYIEI